MNVGQRYRERALPQHISFFGNEKGHKLMAGDQIGTLNEYRSNGTLLSSTIKRLTGTPKDSLSRERTWDELHPGPPYQTGGPFSNIKIVFPSAKVQGVGRFGDAATRKWYIGGHLPSITSVGATYDDMLITGSSSPWNTTNFPSVTSYYNKAWDLLRSSIKIDKAGFSQFVYELRDLPGMLQTTSKGFHDAWSSLGGRDGDILMRPKSVADHFLNHNFGWVPFVNDLLKFYETYQRSDEYIARSVRDNNRWIRRKVVVERTEIDELLLRTYGSLMEPSGFDMDSICDIRSIDGVPTTGFCDTRQKVSTNVWAVGSFKYYRPEFDDSLRGFSSQWSNTKRLLQLYGAKINPSVLWKITPWSWLIDWFFAVGRNIDIANQWAEDSVAARYAYILHHQFKELVQTHIRFYKSGPIAVILPRVIETKQRVNAGSPYGFALNWANLSPKQYAILGAIGITRM